MMKVKHERTADCVVGGFRWHKAGGVVGSLLLGLFDDDGRAPPRRRGLRLQRRPTGGVRRRARAATGAAPPTGHPWLAERHARGPGPRGPEPVERRQGPQLGAAAARAGRRGGLRPPAGRPLPPRHLVRPLAARPEPGSCTYAQLDTPVPDRAGRGLRHRPADRRGQRLGDGARPGRPAPGPGSAGTRLRTPRSALATGASRPRRAGRGPPAGWPGPGRARPARARSARRSASLAAPRTDWRTSGSHSATSSGTSSKLPVVGQHHRRRALAPPGQTGEAVGGVAHQGQPVGDGPGRDAELGPHPVLVGDRSPCGGRAGRPARRPRTGPGPCPGCR